MASFAVHFMQKRRQLFCCNNFWFLSVESSNFSQYILPSKTVVFFCFCESGCKTGDNSGVALLNTHSLEKRNNIFAEGNRNDGTKQFNHLLPSWNSRVSRFINNFSIIVNRSSCIILICIVNSSKFTGDQLTESQFFCCSPSLKGFVINLKCQTNSLEFQSFLKKLLIWWKLM